MSASVRLLSLFSLASIAACGPERASTVVDTSPEPAGANCARGGVRIDLGGDTDGDGILDPSEIDNTEYVCNGTDGASGSGDLIKLSDAGTTCALGGTKIEVGRDTNANGALDTSEVTSTRYVCNGGVGDIVDAFSEAELTLADNTNATAQTATLTIPAAGSVFAIATVDAFCSTATGTGYQCSTATVAADICLRITTAANAQGCPTGTEPSAFAYLTAGVTENLTHMDVFPVTPGTATFYARAATTNDASTGQVGLWRRGLTLIYVPDASAPIQ